ncbi:hypothetical protein L228DRAFT_282752 [Xylona heveae TC161]|uniref:Protein FYV10 n=1 Tax=Xylona heveae (strain CBS 132557 / TC161) TaxID=1328760 RepID=A0A165GVU7_XYLHT|nr:hypothetical protein L228DRAFT_282752 [Xylona heveae TC161]KZF22660.1 hypothetical protein L228DRAFT_282752 [Xylona heveae TC161]
MAELTSIKLNAESHLLLDQSLLRLPYELLRKNFKTSQRLVEREREHILSAIKSTASASVSLSSTAQTQASLDSMITRMQGLKRKLEVLHEEEKAIHEHSRKRIQHLQALYDIPSLVDVKYDEWSRVRLNRLLVDYLLRSGYGDSALALAQEKHIEDLVDVDVFVQCHKIEESLRQGRTQECLLWCSENKQALKKMNSSLEFEVRLQQFIELVRSGQIGETKKLLEATQHARKYLIPHKDTQSKEIHRSAGLLAFAPDTQVEPYKSMYSRSRWDFIAQLFVKTHHELLSLPVRPLLHIALSAGLSALKTPACHSAYASSSSNASSSTTTVCPICSTELNELARNVPYAHHTKSYVESDPMVLPNGRIYGRDRLLDMSRKVGLGEKQVKDPTTGEIFHVDSMEKVFIS